LRRRRLSPDVAGVLDSPWPPPVVPSMALIERLWLPAGRLRVETNAELD